LPAFYLGVVLVVIFAVQLDWLPSGGATPFFEDPLKNIKQLILPSATLGIIMTSYTTRLTRSSMLNVLNQDYMDTARSKGLAEQVILTKHGLRSAAIPIVAVTEIEVHAKSSDGRVVLVEVKKTQEPMGSREVEKFQEKIEAYERTGVTVLPAFLSLGGFTGPAADFCKQKGIALA